MSKITWQASFVVPPDDSDGLCGVKFEDAGQAAIMYSPLKSDNCDDRYYSDVVGDDGGQFFVQLHSWDGVYEDAVPGQKTFRTPDHPFFRSLMGRRVRITIETVDED